MEPQTFDELRPNVVLGIAAHPDDLDFGAAGTLAKFAAAGAEVYYLLLTDGSKGSDDYSISPTELIKKRQTEQRAALTLLGGKEVDFLDYPDGGLELSMDVKRDVVRAIRRRKPDVVLCMDPTMVYSERRNFINHSDHRVAGQAALDAVYPLARDHMSFPELFADGFEPHKTKTVLMMNFDKNNFVVDISSTISTKLAAVGAHASQLPNAEESKAFFTKLAAEAGAPYGYQYAETFIRLDIR